MSYEESLADVGVSELVGKELVNASGEELGDVDKVVVNRNTNEKMVVIGLKGIVGDAAKEVAIPIDQIKMSPSGDKIETNLSKEDLEVRPDIDPGDFTELKDNDG